MPDAVTLAQYGIRGSDEGPVTSADADQLADFNDSPDSVDCTSRSMSEEEEPFVSWRDQGYENPAHYKLGGYHPVSIGDCFKKGRYRVVHKLGHGTYSTVWLVRDEQLHAYCSMKIMIADFSKRTKEADILHRLSLGSNHPGKQFVQRWIDSFFFDGPNGTHLGIVTEAAGCTARLLAEMDANFPLQFGRSMAAQLLLGLDYIHSCGVGHADLHLGNILFRISEKESLDRITSDEELYDEYGPVVKLPLKVGGLNGEPKGPGMPDYIVTESATWLPDDNALDETVRVIICDFSEAFTEQQVPQKLHAPNVMLPPEHFFNEKIGLAADIWIMASTLYNVLGACDGIVSCDWEPDDDYVVADYIHAVGPLPDRWWKRWEKKHLYFSDDGNARTSEDRPQPLEWPLLKRIEHMHRAPGMGYKMTCRFPDDEKKAVYELLRNMLRFEPSERLTAAQAASSLWMQKWGLPTLDISLTESLRTESDVVTMNEDNATEEVSEVGEEEGSKEGFWCECWSCLRNYIQHPRCYPGDWCGADITVRFSSLAFTA